MHYMRNFVIFLSILTICLEFIITEANPSDVTAKKRRERGPSRVNSNPDAYLEKFGYLPKLAPGVAASPAARENAIRNFQRFAGLRVTGELDRKTLSKMAAPRCGVPDVIPDDTVFGQDGRSASLHAPQNYHVPGYKWSKTALTWRAENYSPDMASSSQRRAFYNAFKYWSDVTPLQFRETSNQDADILIRFGGYNHGDSYPFDGTGGTLAHAFFPEQGDTHFDESEQWTENTEQGTNLEIVAAHEFGHALGLGHSAVSGALMAPFYQGFDPKFKLHQDDINGIRELYGSYIMPTTPPITRPPVTPTPTGKTKIPKPERCEGKFDDLYRDSDGFVYAFVGKWVWRLGYWQAESGFPERTYRIYRPRSPPAGMNAAVRSWRTQYTYYFKGRQVHQYWYGRRVQRKTIRDSSYRVPQAALMSGDGKIYLIAGSYAWQFNETSMLVVEGSRIKIGSKWPGIPTGITATVRLTDGYVYFFKGDRYWKYQETARRVVSGPNPVAPAWIGPECSSGGRYTPK